MSGNGKAGAGALLRYWRELRRRSQLDLSLDSGISTRHLSYVETGRASPSRDVVLRIAQALDVPLRERNLLLAAAGFAPVFAESLLDSPELAPVLRGVEFILERHAPCPAIAVDRHWNIVRQNEPALRWFSRFVADPALLGAELNTVRLVLDGRGLRPFICNWEELVASLAQRLHRELSASPGDTRTRALLDELLACQGAPKRARVPDYRTPQTPVLAMRLEREGLALNLFSAITTLGTPLDVTAQELRIDTFFPADAATDKLLREL